MKANRNSIMNQDDRAQVGIGTMIVFIATILVAATAAAVLIDTSGKLQERSSSTGDQATKQVASNLIVKSVAGERDATTDDIELLDIYIALAPGADKVDLQQLEIEINDGINVLRFEYAAANAANKFVPDFIRDQGTTTPVMTAGDLVKLEIDNNLVSVTFAERTDVKVTLMPEVGSSADASFTTPESFGTDLQIWLR